MTGPTAAPIEATVEDAIEEASVVIPEQMRALLRAAVLDAFTGSAQTDPASGLTSDLAAAADESVDAIAELLPELFEQWQNPPCAMTHQEPYDFASCETHDTTFPLGDRCKFYGRQVWEVYADEADEQRRRAVAAEMQMDRVIEHSATAFKGPRDTDASMLREAAKRASNGYIVGGSNLSATVAGLLGAVADILDARSVATADTAGR